MYSAFPHTGLRIQVAQYHNLEVMSSICKINNAHLEKNVNAHILVLSIGFYGASNG